MSKLKVESKINFLIGRKQAFERGEFFGPGAQRDKKQMRDYFAFIEASEQIQENWRALWDNYYKTQGSMPICPDPWSLDNGYAVGIYLGICSRIQELLRKSESGDQGESYMPES